MDIGIRPEFKVHMLNSTGLQRAEQLAVEFSRLLTLVEEMAGQSRETSIVRTKLEEACFFAKRAVAQNPENQL